MSKKHCHHHHRSFFNFGGGCNGQRPNLVWIIILILIILQFGKKNNEFGTDRNEGIGKIDNGILFIIAIYYLSCCNPCRTSS